MIIALALALAAPTVADVKSLVAAHLKDPGSAQYSGIKLLHDERVKNGPVNSFCGYVNAKNSYGGYEGKSFFNGSFSDREVNILPPELSPSGMCE